MRRGLDQWFDGHGIRPYIVGEFDDSALVFEFGKSGSGVFAVPSIVEGDIRRQYDLVRVGRVDEVRRQLFAVGLQGRFNHPAVVALIARARGERAR